MLLKCGHCKRKFEASKNQAKRSSFCKENLPKFGFACSKKCQNELAIKGRDPNRNRLSVRKLSYSRLNNAVAQGRIKRPEFCERCNKNPGTDSLGRSRIEGHHPDHSKPFEVIWLCDSCHKEETPRARGERVWASRLKAKDVRKIRRLLTLDYGVNEIGEMFGVTHKAISDVRDGVNWSWLK